MPRKIPDEKKKEIQTKDDLERLLASGIEDLQLDIENAKNILPGRNTAFMDYSKVKDFSDTKAKDIIDAISVFYLTEDVVETDPYIKEKCFVDKITVSNLLFQMKTAEHAIIKLLEEIDNGNMQPRSFEVLASLQKSKMEIVKHLAQFMVIMENNYKSLKEDYRTKVAEEPQLLDNDSSESSSNSPLQIRGTRSIIETLREAIPEKRASSNPNEHMNQDV
jgi:hypothetical protein